MRIFHLSILAAFVSTTTTRELSSFELGAKNENFSHLIPLSNYLLIFWVNLWVDRETNCDGETRKLKKMIKFQKKSRHFSSSHTNRNKSETTGRRPRIRIMSANLKWCMKLNFYRISSHPSLVSLFSQVYLLPPPLCAAPFRRRKKIPKRNSQFDAHHLHVSIIFFNLV